MALSSELVDLKTADGTMAAFVYGHKDNSQHPAVIVIQEIFGVNRHVQDIAQKYRDEGFVTIAPDLFYRGGRLMQMPYNDFQTGMAQAGQLTEERLVADLSAVVQYLQKRSDVDSNRIAIAGYCLGGRVAYVAAAKVNGIKAAAAHYPGGVVRNPQNPAAVTPISYAADVKAPIIVLAGNADQNPSPEDVNKLEQTLKGLGKTVEVHRYEGAGHGFMCEDRPSYNAAAAKDAFPKTVRFFKHQLHWVE